MLLKVHDTYYEKDYLVNTNSILFIQENKVYFTPTCYIEVRKIDITNIRKNMK